MTTTDKSSKDDAHKQNASSNSALHSHFYHIKEKRMETTQTEKAKAVRYRNKSRHTIRIKRIPPPLLLRLITTTSSSNTAPFSMTLPIV